MELIKKKLINKSIAVIGAGASGIVSAKYAKVNNLNVTVFEKGSQLGGIWNHDGYTWDSMSTNGCKYTTEFSDFYFNEGTDIYPSSKTVLNYLHDYSKHFQVFDTIKFNSQVTNVNYIKDNTNNDNNQWNVTWKSLKDNKEFNKNFDYLIVSSGIHRQPKWGPYSDYISDKTNDKIKLIHSAIYKNSKEFKDKTVIVVGNSFSSSQIAVDLVGSAKSVINVYRKNVWCLEKYIVHPNFKKLVPHDCYIISRDFAINNDEKVLDLQTANKKLNKKMSMISEQNSINKDLFNNPDSTNGPKHLAAEKYLKYIKERLIKNIKTNIINITNNTVYLENGEKIKADIVILATGYILELPFIGEELSKQLEYDPNDYVNPYLLYYRTINPMFKNLAFVGVFKGLFIQTCENQAKFAFECLLNRHKVKENDINLYFENIREIRKNPYSEKAQIVVANNMKFSDMIMEELGLMPDLDKIKEEDEELYEYLYYGPIIPAHYSLNKNKDDPDRNKAVDYIKKLGQWMKL